jgi:uncharacterized RDD family membrane protein YckC
MVSCPACDGEVPADAHWCEGCHANVLNPTLGQLAPPLRRLAAAGLDVALPGLALSLNFVGSAGGRGSGASAALGCILLLGYVLWALWLFARGTTPGKRALGLRVVREDGRPAALGVMLVREWFGKTLSGLAFSLGLVWILLDRDRQGWHDKLVGTYVVA